MSKKLTLADLLTKKEQLKKKKKRTMALYIESLDAEIVIEEPSRAFAMEAIEMAQDQTRSDQADAHVVYNCVIEPNLKDKDLQKQFECVEPTDIVDIIFRSGEVSAISGHVLELAGYGQGVQKVDKELKN
ncbi:phage tail assembly chaperone [Chengkuizengella marina]|uniref:Phage XkdN-like tail assembly chaperone protein, TAC n=1 Tax=Chengkuizengella marina TaxID=2507566 RepID=A0A6N9Q7S9_9BACL|nr:hypothetical protein [Chengkuizengella marina]NBI30908.1 hypothetical protein [Chengkuizengella marina]